MKGVNFDYFDTYSGDESGASTVRYPSDAKNSIDGWAYVCTQDLDYVERLSFKHYIEVEIDGQWVPYEGYLPNSYISQ